MKSDRETALQECTMLTGVASKDLSYLCYLLLKDGVYFNKPQSFNMNGENTVDSLEDWFNNIRGE